MRIEMLLLLLSLPRQYICCKISLATPYSTKADESKDFALFLRVNYEFMCIIYHLVAMSGDR